MVIVTGNRGFDVADVLIMHTHILLKKQEVKGSQCMHECSMFLSTKKIA